MPTIPASERAKTVHVLDPSDTVTGKVFVSNHVNYGPKFCLRVTFMPLNALFL
jgi:hypothetical protein